jgi:2,3-bisphosphoglycerate-independent phosphoglycerate mutase
MKKILLCILDGFGICENKFGNATIEAPFINGLLARGVLLDAMGESVGLPSGQFGNSEVGHLTIGAGRVLKQKLPLINDAIQAGGLAKNQKLRAFLSELDTCHLMGLFSSGGVHSDLSHLFWAVKLLRNERICAKCHLFLDGRDVGYKEGLGALAGALEREDLLLEEIATIQGRFYAMDRDKRWERTKVARDLIVEGVATHKCSDPLTLIRSLYDQGITDETLPQIAVGNYEGATPGSSFWCLNFRADRIQQILSLLLEDGFKAVSMASCGEEIDAKATILFEQEAVRATLGEVLSQNGVRQLRVAETEKYAHVTYFLNGGVDVQYALEDRILIPSPKVSDYATTPEMSAPRIMVEVENAMKNASHDVIIVNFANADMIGHTGDFDATKKAIRILDDIIKKSAETARASEYVMVITADHGNAEMMINAGDLAPHKSHTGSKVPFICLPQGDFCLKSDGTLRDIAPTILQILGITPPAEMTGASLLRGG